MAMSKGPSHDIQHNKDVHAVHLKYTYSVINGGVATLIAIRVSTAIVISIGPSRLGSRGPPHLLLGDSKLHLNLPVLWKRGSETSENASRRLCETYKAQKKKTFSIVSLRIRTRRISVTARGTLYIARD